MREKQYLIDPTDELFQDFSREDWERYAGKTLVLSVEIGTNRQGLIAVLNSVSEFSELDYPEHEMVETFEVPEKGSIMPPDIPVQS